MGITFTDSTSNTQRLAASNSGAVEIGFAAPTSGLSIQGNQLLSGPSLAPNTIPPSGLSRITGFVALTSKTSATINTGQTLAGFGTVDGATIIRFDGNSFTTALMTNTDGVTKTCSYSVI
jgi:hypothetical protein